MDRRGGGRGPSGGSGRPKVTHRGQPRGRRTFGAEGARAPSATPPPPTLDPNRERTCVITRESLPPEALVRICVDPDGRAAVDLRGKAGGRGAWLVPTRAAFEAAEARPEKLRRALKTEGLVVEGLLAAAQEAVLRQVLDLLSLAARAGALASGGDQVDEALAAVQEGANVGVIFPDDASARSVEDVRRSAGELPCFTLPVTREALGHRIGKGPRAAVVLRRASVTMALVRELRKMEGLR